MVVVSMTTSPNRLPYIGHTIRHLVEKQTVKPDKIHLNIPFVFKRTSEQYDLTKLPPMPACVEIHRCDDLGPITKVVPTVRRLRCDYPDALVIVVDDDIQYDPQMIEQFVKAAASNPESVISRTCLDGTNEYETDGCMLEGFKGYAVRPSHFGAAFDHYLEIALRNEQCYKGDDYVISNFFYREKVPIIPIANVSFQDVVLPLGLNRDALHQQLTTPQALRYCGCFQYLQEHLDQSNMNTKCHLS
jgi:hypothetical protein